MRKMWWKILGVVILLYVIIYGMTTPLKPGITDVSNFQVQAGTTQTFTISGYNTNYDKAKTRAWLKLDSTNILSTNIKVIDYNTIDVTATIPSTFPSNDRSLTLITYNKVDGPSVLPNAVSVLNATTAPSPWKSIKIADIHDKAGIQFPYRSTLNETIRNTFFHIPLWFSMFILLMIGLWYSVRYLRKKNIKDDIMASSLTTVAIVFGLLGIATGSIWARFTWGAWWSPDVKLNMSATAMLIYCAYVVLRSSLSDIDRRAQLSAAYSIFAFIALIPLVIVIPRLTASLHPGNGGNPALGGEDMEHTLMMAFYPAIIGFTLLGLWISSLVIRYKLLKEERLN